MDGKIINSSGKVNNYIHHIDLKEFGKERILSCYVAEFDDCTLILDCGSSLEVNRLLRYLKNNDIALESVKYLVTTHHHFDHNGGAWKVYEKIKKFNPNFKIISNPQTKYLLNNYETHLNRAKRTFGDFIGDMKDIENEAYLIVEPENEFKKEELRRYTVDSFSLNGKMIDLALLKTSGHTPDHQCPFFIVDGEVDFLFLGEAAGTIYHSEKFLTMPTSMPVYFEFGPYMESLHNLKQLNAKIAGFCHFGVICGQDNVEYILDENEQFMKEFRSKIIEYYETRPETRYVFEKMMPHLTPRTDLVGKDHPIMKNIVLGIVYGMMMDLGYRNE
jgi:glyoxylase-like metal-dependent hydrolase (beta-lactamase superfamily II)